MDPNLYFNYALQAWVKDYVVQQCDHPYIMRVNGPCCNANRYAGLHIQDALVIDEEQRASDKAKATA